MRISNGGFNAPCLQSRLRAGHVSLCSLALVVLRYAKTVNGFSSPTPSSSASFLLPTQPHQHCLLRTSTALNAGAIFRVLCFASSSTHLRPPTNKATASHQPHYRIETIPPIVIAIPEKSLEQLRCGDDSKARLAQDEEGELITASRGGQRWTVQWTPTSYSLDWRRFSELRFDACFGPILLASSKIPSACTYTPFGARSASAGDGRGWRESSWSSQELGREEEEECT
ncbi:unnamed protein product [Cercospora beticola]|nr:unnamed protein product [Cercospora beticola]